MHQCPDGYYPNIEQNQILPTKGNVKAIFEGLPAQSKKKVNHFFEEAFKNLTKNQSSLSETKPENDNSDIRKGLGRLKEVKPSFSNSYWKLALTTSEINPLNQNIMYITINQQKLDFKKIYQEAKKYTNVET